MPIRSMNIKLKTVFFCAFFLVAQLYFVVLSTHHAFMGMPTTCPICTLVNAYDDVITSVAIVVTVNSFSQYDPQQLPVFTSLFRSSFLPRAPPFI